MTREQDDDELLNDDDADDIDSADDDDDDDEKTEPLYDHRCPFCGAGIDEALVEWIDEDARMCTCPECGKEIEL